MFFEVLAIVGITGLSKRVTSAEDPPCSGAGVGGSGLGWFPVHHMSPSKDQ